MSQGAPRCSIVIPVHDRAALTRQCLEAIATDPPAVPFEVVVVDDASTDATREVLQGQDWVRVVTREQNAGFATACNDGAAAARGELLVFLNNDTIPLAGWLDGLVGYADARPRVGVVGSKLVFPNGTIQHAGVVVCQDGNPRHLYAGFPSDHPAVNKSRAMQAVTAACMLVDRALFERAGGFDDAYHNSLEDVDLCLRLRELGGEVHYCHESVLVHLESVSRGKRTAEIAANSRVFRSRWDGKARRDDFDYYLADGLIRVHHRDAYPVRLEVAPELAVVTAEQADELERLVESQARQVFDLMRETVRLTTHVAELELSREAAPPPRAARPSPGEARPDPEELMRRARDIEVEIGELQAGLAEAIGGNGSVSEWSGALGQPGEQVLFSPSNYLRYRKLLRRLRGAVTSAVPPGATVLVISRGDEELTEFDGRTGWHFPREDDGTYQGHHPADSAEAIEHLESLRSRGAGFLVVPDTAAWWLEHYAEFGSHVRARYESVAAEDGYFELFSLAGPG
jgi:GT2 family glycosyltransferase